MPRLTVVSAQSIFVAPGLEVELHRFIYIPSLKVVRGQARENLRVVRESGPVDFQEMNLVSPFGIAEGSFRGQNRNQNPDGNQRRLTIKRLNAGRRGDRRSRSCTIQSVLINKVG